MTDYQILFEEPHELDFIAYKSKASVDSPAYKNTTLWGYKKGIDYFFRIFWIFKEEMYYMVLIEDKEMIFDKVLTILRDLEEPLTEYITDLKKYKFNSAKLKNPFVRKHTDVILDHGEITVNKISRMINKIRRHRIEFYEIILQEYIARKDKYNEILLKQLENGRIAKDSNLIKGKVVDRQVSLNKSKEKDFLFMESYDLDVNVWFLRDVLQLRNPKTDKYTKNLQRYRADTLWGYKEGIDHLFEILLIFKKEMDPIVAKKDFENKNVFNRTLTLLFQFLREFEERGDLEDVLVDYIDKLEKYEFFSLQKEALFDKISQMIYSLRRRRIEFYETALKEYSANKEKYDKRL